MRATYVEGSARAYIYPSGTRSKTRWSESVGKFSMLDGTNAGIGETKEERRLIERRRELGQSCSVRIGRKREKVGDDTTFNKGCNFLRTDLHRSLSVSSCGQCNSSDLAVACARHRCAKQLPKCNFITGTHSLREFR